MAANHFDAAHFQSFYSEEKSTKDFASISQYDEYEKHYDYENAQVAANSESQQDENLIQQFLQAFEEVKMDNDKLRDHVHQLREELYFFRQPRREEALSLAERLVGLEFDTASIPPREWLVSGLILMGYVTLLQAAGGVGKTKLIIALLISIAAGIDPLELGIERRARVLFVSNEEDTAEIQRMIAATCQHFGITKESLTNWLHVVSGYGRSITLAKADQWGNVGPAAGLGGIIELVRSHHIEVVALDPLVSLHDGDENSNSVQEKVAQALRSIAHETGAGIVVAQHTKKSGTGKKGEEGAGDAESGRGASSIKDAARVVATLVPMADATAEKLGIGHDERRRLVRLDDAKKNYALKEAGARWLRLASVQLVNGDWCGVMECADIGTEAIAYEGKKAWTPVSTVTAIDGIMLQQLNPCFAAFSDVKIMLMKQEGISEKTARDALNSLSTNPKLATRIMLDGSAVEYWISQEGGYKTAPKYINRRGVL